MSPTRGLKVMRCFTKGGLLRGMETRPSKKESLPAKAISLLYLIEFGTSR